MVEYDIVVVGAGPAGSSAAKTVAERGLKTVLIEEHTSIGIPVHCNGGIPPTLSSVARSVLKTMDKRVILRKYKAARVYAPSGKLVKETTITGKDIYLIDRARFDQEMARQAVNAGAELLINTKVTGLIRKGGRIAGITTGSSAHPEIYGKVVIAADGIHAVQKGIPFWAGLTPPDQTYIRGISFELTRVQGLEPETLEMHAGTFSPKGWMTVFPRDAVSCLTSFETLADYERVKAGCYALSGKIKDASPLRMVGYSHASNLGVRLPKIISDGLILTGSAANCRGTIPVIVTGIAAGEAAAEAVLSGDVTEKGLSKYEGLLSQRLPRSGFMYTGFTNILPFANCSDSEIEKRLMEIIEKDRLPWP
jgi:digeranylgeranylglycerophospholipid reductase